MIVYAAIIIAIVFAEHGMAMAFPEPVSVSPVSMGAELPVIIAEPIVRRLDI